MQRFIFLLLSILVSMNGFTQAKKHNWFFGSQVALLNGDNSSNALVTATGGIIYKRFSVGIGTGVDHYKIRSVPVFVSTQYQILANKKLFVYADFGANAAWAKDDQHNGNSFFWGASPSSFTGGIFSDFGIGTFIDKKRGRFFLAAGYSTKTMKESFDELVFSPGPWPTPSSRLPRTYEYTFNRIVFKFGIRI